MDAEHAAEGTQQPSHLRRGQQGLHFRVGQEMAQLAAVARRLGCERDKPAEAARQIMERTAWGATRAGRAAPAGGPGQSAGAELGG